MGDLINYILEIQSLEGEHLAEHQWHGRTLPRKQETIPIFPYNGPAIKELRELVGPRREEIYDLIGLFEQLRTAIEFANQWRGLYRVKDVQHDGTVSLVLRFGYGEEEIIPVTEFSESPQERKFQDNRFDGCFLGPKMPRVIVQPLEEEQ